MEFHKFIKLGRFVFGIANTGMRGIGVEYTTQEFYDDDGRCFDTVGLDFYFGFFDISVEFLDIKI